MYLFHQLTRSLITNNKCHHIIMNIELITTVKYQFVLLFALHTHNLHNKQDIAYSK